MEDRIQRYIHELFVPEDELLAGFQAKARAAGLPLIQVPAELGRLLQLIVRMTGARRVLEIGTLGGYSATWMARALPADGKIISLEVEPKHAEFARGFLESGGVGEKVEIIVGRAVDSLPALLEREEPSFDLVFIDADKQSYPAYLDWALRLARPGGVIVADNVLRGSKVLDPGENAELQGLAEFNQHVAASPLLDALLIPNRGGEDGIVLAVLREPSE